MLALLSFQPEEKKKKKEEVAGGCRQGAQLQCYIQPT